MLTAILGFIFSAKFIIGAIAGAVIALIIKNNISKKQEASAQSVLDQANAKIKELASKIK